MQGEQLETLFNRVNKPKQRKDILDGFTPREIQILSELINALEEQEFAIDIKDQNKIVGPNSKEKGIQYHLKNKNAVRVAKVERISRNKDEKISISRDIVSAVPTEAPRESSEEDLSESNPLESTESLRLSNENPPREKIPAGIADMVYTETELGMIKDAEAKNFSKEFETDIDNLFKQYFSSSPSDEKAQSTEVKTAAQRAQSEDSSRKRDEAGQKFLNALKADYDKATATEKTRMLEALKNKEAAVDKKRYQNFLKDLDEKDQGIVEKQAFDDLIKYAAEKKP